MEEQNTENVISKKPFYFKIGGGILVLFIWTGLILLKIYTEISLIAPFIIAIFISIAFLVFLFYNNISKLIKHKEINKNDIPEPMSEDKVYEVLHETVRKMMNHILKSSQPTVETFSVHKEQIYLFKIELLHNQFKDNPRNIAKIIINATYPNIAPTILPGSIGRLYTLKSVNAKAQNPKEDPDSEITTVENPLTGIKSTTVKKSHKKKSKQVNKPEAVM